MAKGGRGSGKSHFFGGLLVEDSLREPGENGGEGLRSVCIREVQQDLSQSSKRLIELKLQQFNLGEADGFKVFKDVIQTPGDGLMIFKGMNNYNADSIKSLEGFKRSWWEEAHGAASTSINLLRPTMRAPGSQMWWSYNPLRRVDAVDKLFTGELPTGAKVVKANWRDNPWFTPELEQERLDCLRLQPDLYDHIWEGDYVSSIDGAYFAAHLKQAQRQDRIKSLAYDPMLPLYSYHDIGGAGARADAYTIWLQQRVGADIYWLDYYETRGQTLAYHANWMRQNGYETAEIILPHDGLNTNNISGKTYEDHWREAGFSSTRVVPNQGKGAATQRIEAGRRLFPRMYFDEKRTEAGRLALGWYHERIDENRDVGLGPEHDWSSHGADSFGLGAIDYEEPQGAPQALEMEDYGYV